MTNHHQVGNVWNVLEDTPSRAAEMRIRSELMMTLSDIVHTNNMTPSDAAQLFGVTTAAIQALNRGKISQFSLDALVGMAATAGMTPSIRVAQPKLSPLKKPNTENRQSPVQLSASATPSAEPKSQPSTKFPALSEETRTHVTTEHAAWLLGRACQTLRVWACYESRGPLRPIRIAGRLAWPVAEIKRALGVK
jgi:predicted XRE-type DNA-binding protein